MKKLTALVLSLAFTLALAGCHSARQSGKWDKIPMLMVDGILYLDTGRESTAKDRREAMDGEITSEVDGSEAPTANGQSNFGSGFGWQYGEAEGTIEVYMNGRWIVFAEEKAG